MQLPRLREWRERRGLTQQELADAVGVARDSISKWETLSRGAYPSTARKLAEALYIPVEDLTAFSAPAQASGRDLQRRVAVLKEAPDTEQVMVFRYRMMLLSRDLAHELGRGKDALRTTAEREENEAAWALLQESPESLSESVHSVARHYADMVAHVRQTLLVLEELEHDLEEAQAAWLERAAS